MSHNLCKLSKEFHVFSELSTTLFNKLSNFEATPARKPIQINTSEFSTFMGFRDKIDKKREIPLKNVQFSLKLYIKLYIRFPKICNLSLILKFFKTSPASGGSCLQDLLRGVSPYNLSSGGARSARNFPAGANEVALKFNKYLKLLLKIRNILLSGTSETLCILLWSFSGS